MRPDDYELNVGPLSLDYHASAWVDMHPHIGTLAGLAADARSVLELGVRGAVSSWAILDGLPGDGHLVSVDAIDVVEEGLVPRRVREDPRWRFVIGDTLDPLLPLPDSVDLVFIDAGHEYHETIGELELAERLGATVIALHDYQVPDVADAIHGFKRRRYPWHLTVEPSTWGFAVLRR